MVDWKAIPKIDAHIHLLPEDVIQANGECDDPFVVHGSMKDYLKVMDANQIECAFIVPFNDPYMLSMDFNVQTVHSNLLKMVLDNPARFKCFADVDMRQDINQTLGALDCALCHEAFVGIKLHPSNAAYPIDGEYYDQIFCYANDKGILVEIHSYPRANLSDDLCSPGRIRRVLGKYPGLKLSVAHLGGFQYEELYDMNAYFNMSSVLPDLARKFGIACTNKILRSLSVDKLVFATDYPDSRCLKSVEIYDTYFEILGQMDFTQAEAEQICRHNALKMIGMA